MAKATKVFGKLHYCLLNEKGSDGLYQSSEWKNDRIRKILIYSRFHRQNQKGGKTVFQVEGQTFGISIDTFEQVDLICIEWRARHLQFGRNPFATIQKN